MNRTLHAGACALAMMTASGAGATTLAPWLMTVDYFGTVQTGNWPGATGFDERGLFGTAGNSLLGQAFQARYVFDLNLGTISPGPRFRPGDLVAINANYVNGSGLASPVLSATVSVGGSSWEMPGLPPVDGMSGDLNFGEFAYGNVRVLATPQTPAYSYSFQSHSASYNWLGALDGATVRDEAFLQASASSTAFRIPEHLGSFDVSFADTENGTVEFGVTRQNFDEDIEETTAFTARVNRVTINVGLPPPAEPGTTPDDPLMPTSTTPDGGFRFDFLAQFAQPVFWDPVVSVGYDYLISAGGGASQLWFVDLGDADGYELYLWNEAGLSYDFFGAISAGTWIDIGGVTSRFRLLGIDPALELDPTNPMAFVTGAIGLNGSVALTMTPITFDTDAAPGVVPEPASWAMMIAGFGLTGVTLRRRRRAFA